ncbi:hypothetical protein S245_031566 [Arachis hypogaea]
MLTEGLNQRHFPGLKFSLQKLKRNWCNIVVLIQSKLVLELPPLVGKETRHFGVLCSCVAWGSKFRSLIDLFLAMIPFI